LSIGLQLISHTDTQFFTKNKLVESTDHEAGLSDATSTEV